MSINTTRCYKKTISKIVTIFIIIVTMFLVAEKANLVTHSHCEEEQCPTCEIAYIVNKELKNVFFGNAYLKLVLLMSILFVASKCTRDNIFVKELSLVKCKVRLND